MGDERRPDGRSRPSNPMQGDDLFSTRRSARQNAPLFGLSGDDPDDFWGNLDVRHAQHRQHVILLLIAIALICVPGILVHPGFFAFAAGLLILVAVELFMMRQTRTRSKIPDYRPPERVGSTSTTSPDESDDRFRRTHRPSPESETS